MTTNPLDELIEKLATGDDTAAEEVFRTYEPVLRMVVRRQLSGGLRAKFDSIDIVQSVWSDVLQGLREAKWNFRDPAHLRAFLITVTRNRFIDRVRQNRAAVQGQRSLAETDVQQCAASTEPRPSEKVQADDVWQQMLSVCPPAHRELLNLKRQGKSLSEIAQHTGLHPSSVRRILYEIARRLEELRANSE
jgi:RNA polymerase sigma-70 factor (ECF subfamily)